MRQWWLSVSWTPVEARGLPMTTMSALLSTGAAHHRTLRRRKKRHQYDQQGKSSDSTKFLGEHQRLPSSCNSCPSQSGFGLSGMWRHAPFVVCFADARQKRQAGQPTVFSISYSFVLLSQYR